MQKRSDKTITMQDVEEFFKNNIEEKRKPRGQNSFVAPYAYHTFQIDLFFISKKDLGNQKFRVGLVPDRCFLQICSRCSYQKQRATRLSSGNDGGAK